MSALFTVVLVISAIICLPSFLLDFMDLLQK